MSDTLSGDQNNKQPEPAIPAASSLDLRGTYCPMAFVKTRIFLDTQANGTKCTILFEKTAANEPLIRSIKSLGHSVLFIEQAPLKAQIESTFPSTAKKLADDTLQLILTVVQVKK